LFLVGVRFFLCQKHGGVIIILDVEDAVVCLDPNARSLEKSILKKSINCLEEVLVV
jgi:hypothetical protein